jgi:hypothetical protein
MTAVELNMGSETAVVFEGSFWDEGSLCEYGAQELS